MKRLWVATALGVLGLTGLGFVHPFGDPRAAAATRAKPGEGRGALLEHATLPAEAKAVLRTKCADCHSSETRWPVYARVAPGSWLIERDIVAARREMDLSQWETLPAEQQDVLAAKIVQQAKRGSMPPPQYLALHWGARLRPADVQALSGLVQHGDASGTMPGTGPGNAGRGKLLFEKRCTGCHTMDADREGPRLGEVSGRKAGAVPGFNYSAALKNSNLTWTDANLDRWLRDPELLVAGNSMEFRVASQAERRDLIAYLRR